MSCPVSCPGSSPAPSPAACPMPRPNPPAAPAIADERCFLHEAAVRIGEAELGGRSAHHRGRLIGGRAEHNHSRDGSGRQKAVTHTMSSLRLACFPARTGARGAGLSRLLNARDQECLEPLDCNARSQEIFRKPEGRIAAHILRSFALIAKASAGHAPRYAAHIDCRIKNVFGEAPRHISSTPVATNRFGMGGRRATHSDAHASCLLVRRSMCRRTRVALAAAQLGRTRSVSSTTN